MSQKNGSYYLVEFLATNRYIFDPKPKPVQPPSLFEDNELLRQERRLAKRLLVIASDQELAPKDRFKILESMQVQDLPFWNQLPASIKNELAHYGKTHSVNDLLVNHFAYFHADNELIEHWGFTEESIDLLSRHFQSFGFDDEVYRLIQGAKSID